MDPNPTKKWRIQSLAGLQLEMGIFGVSIAFVSHGALSSD
jgi:hypothetical protein